MIKKKKIKQKESKLVKIFIPILALLMIACSSNDDSSPDPDPDPDPPSVETLEGDYIGTWNSTTPTATFTNVGVSARLSFSGTDTNRLIGGFFISSNFEVCCSAGDNDGTLIIDFDGDTITSFRYNDVITGCSGIFDGEGTVRNDGALVINFTGNDCDGDHVGQIILSK